MAKQQTHMRREQIHLSANIRVQVRQGTRLQELHLVSIYTDSKV